MDISRDTEELFVVRKEISDYESLVNTYRRNNNLPDPFSNMSFAGVDITATMVLPKMGTTSTDDIGDIIELGELQTISYSIHRENSPVRTLGHSNVRGFIKGSRTIAGSLIFTVFNEYAFYRIGEFKKILKQRNFAPLADMLPPFDVVLTFFNEYGLSAKMKIYGITIVDEGQTMSVDDLITEQTYTYMARGIQPLMHLDTAEDRNVYGDNPSSDARQEQLLDLNVATNFFGDKVEEYKNFISKIARL